jgi:hypothetical protein
VGHQVPELKMGKPDRSNLSSAGSMATAVARVCAYCEVTSM